MTPLREEHLVAAPDHASRSHDGTHQTRGLLPRPGRRTGIAPTAVTHRPHDRREDA
ncbi:hypothetical protein ACWCPX_45020 [Streptomyces olivaceoviridis]